MKAILLDIEGTTTPIDFVHETLFPYARARVAGFIHDHFDELRAEILSLAAEQKNDSGYTGDLRRDSANSVSDYLKFLIDQDRKSTPLKQIQGEIWKQGYESGELVSPVYEDVPRALERWHADGRTIAIYSSGSVLAQNLLFKYTDQGDLTPFISNYFDTNMGGKRDVESYLRITRSLAMGPSSISFVSDIPEELAAAKEGGLTPILSLRPGNAVVEDHGYWRCVETFDEIN